MQVCKNKCMITPLRPNMSPDVQLFFMDPLEVATKLHKQLLKVLDFQKTQRKRLTGFPTFKSLIVNKFIRIIFTEKLEFYKFFST